MRRLVLVLSLCAISGCPLINLGEGHFSCTTDTDCGSGSKCRAQHAGGSLCFPSAQCNDAESCDGTDQNCDGQIDETFDEQGAACTTSLLGVCAAGTRICEAGALGCTATLSPGSEACNGLDDDCDGQVDETFDFTSDEANCGACGVVCAAETTCLSSRCEESNCANGVDDDGDGFVDCVDPGCLGQACLSGSAPSNRCGLLTAFDAGVPDAGELDAGELDAGELDAGEPDAGALDAGDVDAGAADAGSLRGCFPPENDCANGVDDDGDGVADCLDLDCDSRTCAGGTQCTNLSCPGP